MSKPKYLAFSIDDRKPPKREYSGAFSGERFLVFGHDMYKLSKVDIETFRCPAWVPDE